MTALEIVLVSILGAIVIIIPVYFFILHTNAKNRLEIFDEVNKTAKQGEVVFLGDSLTDFFPIQDFFPDEHIYNRGIAGDTTKDVLKRIDNVITLAPRKIFLQIGTNDLGKGKRPEKVVQSIKKIIDILEENVPGVEIVVISLYPVSRSKKFLSSIIVGLRTNKKIKKTNELLTDYCAEKELLYLDFFTILADKKGRIDKRFTMEGLHISGQGYALIAEALKPHL